MKYVAEDPPVLRDLNIDIQSGWKVSFNTLRHKNAIEYYDKFA